MNDYHRSRASFLQQFRVPPGARTDYHAGIPQALALINGRLISGATGLSTSNLLRSVQAPFFSDEQRIETLFLATLSRKPTEKEASAMLQHLQAAEANRAQALGDILWSLLNCAEFTLNH